MTSVVLIAAEILKWCKSLAEKSNLHPRLFIKHLRAATEYALEHLQKVDILPEVPEERKILLQRASTALNSILIEIHLDLFGPMVVDAVLNLQNNSEVDELSAATGSENRTKKDEYGLAFTKFREHWSSLQPLFND